MYRFAFTGSDSHMQKQLIQYVVANLEQMLTLQEIAQNTSGNKYYCCSPASDPGHCHRICLYTDY